MGTERDRSALMRRWALTWLLLALALAPLLARMHQVVHVPRLVAAVALSPAAVLQASAANGTGASAIAGGPNSEQVSVLALFAHHGTLDCQSLDQLSHGQAPLYVGAWLPPTWGPFLPAQPVPRSHSVPPARHFDARGPPWMLASYTPSPRAWGV